MCPFKSFTVIYALWDYVFTVSHNLMTRRGSWLFFPITCNCFQLNFHKLTIDVNLWSGDRWWMFWRNWGKALFLVVNLRETWKKIRNGYMRIVYSGCFPRGLWARRESHGCWGAGLGGKWGIGRVGKFHIFIWVLPRHRQKQGPEWM